MYSVHQVIRELRNPKINNGLITQLVFYQSKSTQTINPEYIQESKVYTMHFQKSLPRLPIPKLEDSCMRYLKAQRPLLSDDQYKKTEFYAQKFLKSEGVELQEALIKKDKANKHTSYISEPWFDNYLRDRRPLPITYNPCFVYTREADERYNEPLVQATNLIVSSLRFLKSLKAGNLEPEVFHLNPKKSDTKLFRTVTGLLPSAVSWYGAYMFNAYPLDMTQYTNLFNTTRVPQKGKDVIDHDDSGRHLVVIRNGYMYSFDVLDKNGNIVSPRQIASNLRHIQNDNRPVNEKSTGILTASNRDDWAEARNYLSKIQNNSAILKQIDSAVFVLVLDEEIGDDMCTVFRNYLYGDAKNRWYDKSFSLIISKDGYAGINFEHAWGDGVAVLRYFQDVRNDFKKRPSFHPEEVDNLTECSDVKHLDFHLDDKIENIIRNETVKFQEWINDLDIDFVLQDGFGKNECKKHKISPDAFMQLLFQLAFYKMENRSVATYESCSTAAYKHGRTETVRPCTIQTKNFCSAMSKRTIKDSMTDFRKMIEECSKNHSKLIREAAMGQGFDRHLFVLKKIAEQMGKDKIDFFTDPAYAALNYNILSTSTLSNPVLLLGGFGPVVKDGYGIAYRIDDDSVGTLVSSYKTQRSATDFINSMKSSVLDITRLFSVK